MKTQLLCILVCLLCNHCATTCHNSWREVGSADFERTAATEELHGYVGENAFMLKGFSLGEVIMRVEFASIRWNKHCDSVIVVGKIVDAMLGEPLPKVTVAFGTIDTVADTGRVLSTAQTVTNETGQFYLASRLVANAKLTFTLPGYLARIYNFDKIAE